MLSFNLHQLIIYFCVKVQSSSDDYLFYPILIGTFVFFCITRNDKSYEVEIFSKPDCENLYVDDETSRNLNNQTIVYFYVKRHGRISPNSTLMYPRDPTNLEISRELDYLKEKVRKSFTLLEDKVINTSNSKYKSI